MIINNDYKIEATDERNIALMKIGTVQKGENAGKQTEATIGYYSSINDALKAMCKKEIFGTGIKELEEVNAKIEELYKHIDAVVK